MNKRGAMATGVAVAMIGTGPAFSQSIDEEVRRVINNSVSNTVSQVLEEALTRSVALDPARQPKATLFVNPLYNRTDGDFGDGDFEADTFGGLVGGLLKLNQNLFIHGVGAAARADIDTSEDITAYAALIGANYVFSNTKTIKAWATMEFVLAKADSDDEDLDGSAWVIKPSVTASYRFDENLIIEPDVGIAFADVFNVDDTEVSKSLIVGLKIKYRSDKFRPQLNLGYTRTLSPDTDDEGLISVGPELNYVLSPGKLIGLSYSYLTPISASYDLNSHTVLGSFKWTF